MSTISQELPTQRIGETRYTDLASGTVLTSLPSPVGNQGRPCARRSWGLMRGIEEEGSDFTEAPPKRRCKTDPSELELVTQRNQKCSPFLRLPAEIRIRIYDLLAPPSQCILVTRHDEERSGQLRSGARYRKHTKGGLVYHKELPVTPLWRVCRQIYQEITFDVYGQNTFAFQDKDTMNILQDTLSLAQRNSIKRICFSSLIKAGTMHWIELEKFHGLETIVVRLYDCSPDGIEFAIVLLQELGSKWKFGHGTKLNFEWVSVDPVGSLANLNE